MSSRKPRPEAEPEAAPCFRPDMRVADALDADPRVAEVLREYGLRCDRCIVARHETLAEGCTPLGLEVEAIVARLNELQ